MNATQNDPMTQDEPERVKAVARIKLLYAEFESLPTIEALQHRYATTWLDIRDLLDSLSVSEKRAEEAERERDVALEKLRSERRAYQSYIDDTARQRDEAIIAQLSAAAERDSSQASLLRVVEGLDADLIGVAAEALFDAGQTNLCKQLLKQADLIRTALSPHTEK